MIDACWSLTNHCSLSVMHSDIASSLQGDVHVLFAVPPKLESATPASAWTHEPPADITLPAIAFFRTWSGASSAANAGCPAHEAWSLAADAAAVLLSQLQQAKLPRTSAAAACAFAAAVLHSASVSDTAAFASLAQKMAQAMSSVRVRQGIDAPAMLTLLLSALEASCPDGPCAVAALRAAVMSAPQLSLSIDGPVQRRLKAWVNEPEVQAPLIRRALGHQPLQPLIAAVIMSLYH
jgi:hypothetical protein